MSRAIFFQFWYTVTGQNLYFLSQQSRLLISLSMRSPLVTVRKSEIISEYHAGVIILCHCPGKNKNHLRP